MTSCIAYTIDNSDPVRQSVDETIIPLPDKGCHILTIIADGMPEWEGKWTHERGLALFEIAPAQGGVLLGVKPTGKTIFFYGDSITEGSHALGDVACNGNSATCAYPWFCAKALGCTPYYVGYGGSGILREGSLNTFYMTIDWLAYERPLAYEPVPHVIVVNHGTNDGETRDVDFETTLRHSLAHMRERYPNVPFVYMIPFMQTKAHIIREVVAKFDNAYVVETSRLAMTYSDGVHPDPKGAKLAGEMLADALQNIFGKAFFSQKE